ncbi:hypothetical protein EON71_00395 [bacterium]|nr:MAG: hypothetical protein EON71_00395 [bacterium]
MAEAENFETLKYKDNIINNSNVHDLKNFSIYASDDNETREKKNAFESILPNTHGIQNKFTYFMSMTNGAKDSIISDYGQPAIVLELENETQVIEIVKQKEVFESHPVMMVMKKKTSGATLVDIFSVIIYVLKSSNLHKWEPVIALLYDIMFKDLKNSEIMLGPLIEILQMWNQLKFCLLRANKLILLMRWGFPVQNDDISTSSADYVPGFTSNSLLYFLYYICEAAVRKEKSSNINDEIIILKKLSLRLKQLHRVVENALSSNKYNINNGISTHYGRENTNTSLHATKEKLPQVTEKKLYYYVKKTKIICKTLESGIKIYPLIQRYQSHINSSDRSKNVQSTSTTTSTDHPLGISLRTKPGTEAGDYYLSSLIVQLENEMKKTPNNYALVDANESVKKKVYINNYVLRVSIGYDKRRTLLCEVHFDPYIINHKISERMDIIKCYHKDDFVIDVYDCIVYNILLPNENSSSYEYLNADIVYNLDYKNDTKENHTPISLGKHNHPEKFVINTSNKVFSVRHSILGKNEILEYVPHTIAKPDEHALKFMDNNFLEKLRYIDITHPHSAYKGKRLWVVKTGVRYFDMKTMNIKYKDLLKKENIPGTLQFLSPFYFVNTVAGAESSTVGNLYKKYTKTIFP